MANSVAIRLAVEGGAEVRRAFDEAGRAGQQAFQGVTAAADAAGAAADRQAARYQRLAEAARQAEAQARAQASVNALLGVSTPQVGSARASAAVFEEQARAAEAAHARVRAVSDGWRDLGASGRATLTQIEADRARAEANAQASRRLGSLGVTPPAANENALRRLRSDEIRNLMFQGGDIVSSAASGMSPALIALQQAPQIAQTFAGPGGASVKGALTQAGEAATGLAARIGLLGGAVGVATVAIIAGGAALLSYQNRMREVDRLLAGTGRASGASAQQVNAAAVAIAASGEVSVREARSIAATLAATGRIGVEMFVALGRSAKDFAATTGQEVPDATQELAQAFADPAKGAQTLNEKLGFLNARTEETVRNLAEQGDRLGAQRVLFEAYAASLSRAADLTSQLGDATSAFGRVASNVWDSLGQKVSDAFGGATLDRQLELLEARLKGVESARGGAYTFGGLLDYKVEAEAGELRQQIARLQAERARQQQQRTQAQAAQNNRDVMSLVGQLNPAARETDQLRNRVELLRKAISDPVRFGLDPQQLGQVQAAFERLQNLARSAREDIERYGSASAASALRAAQDASRNVGLNPVDRALAERDQALRKDLRDKGLDQLPTREEVLQQFSARAANDNLDARELQSLERERDARLRNIDERETLIETARVETDRIRKEAEEAAKRTAVSQDFIAAMINAESGGNRFAKNPRSSATGLGQFIDETWERLFRKTFPERAAGMDRDQILARRTDREDSIALIRVYAEENRRALERANLPTTNRNQYLAWFAGADRAIRLLNADPTEPAAAYFGRKAIAANPTVIPGRSVGQLLDWADRTINQNAPNIRATQRAADVLRSQVTLQEQATETEAHRQKVQELLNDAIERGTEVGRQFNTAQELLAADSTKLTDTARNERQAILDVADAYAKQTAALETSKLGRDLLFERAQIGRTDGEQRIASRLRGTGLGLDSAEAEAMRLNDRLTETKDLAKDAFSSFASDIRRGVTAAEALQNVITRIVDKLMNKGIDTFINSIFDAGGKSVAGGGGLGDFFSGIGKALGFATGGYTGPGGRYEPAGIVHRGEYVFDAASVSRIGVSTLEAMRAGLRGYADGGYVGPRTFPTMPATAPTNANQPAAGPTFIANITSQATGDPEADQRAAAANAKAMRAEYERMWLAMAQREMRPGGTLHAAGARRAS
ncbi:phage tail length tape measure family protein [Methylobacterium nodulans]|uniref:Prophage tail length tape measure n=1 Tax=Methylobacterium nodulans (strain LMG 21967 / CNCM I-2342 / ORS 2060) TaxID=460265 RepID=B8ISD3_METNO|nr:phage tail length tape measure family protein [Methylobacterium nodulans]ACL58773.1 Prophage tail length tape measure [Methylobacterium nodulans ORS 2060]